MGAPRAVARGSLVPWRPAVHAPKQVHTWCSRRVVLVLLFMIHTKPSSRSSSTRRCQRREQNGPKPQPLGDSGHSKTVIKPPSPWEGMWCPQLRCGRRATANAAGSGMTCHVDPTGSPPCPYTLPSTRPGGSSPGANMRPPDSTRCPAGVRLG